MDQGAVDGIKLVRAMDKSSEPTLGRVEAGRKRPEVRSAAWGGAGGSGGE